MLIFNTDFHILSQMTLVLIPQVHYQVILDYQVHKMELITLSISLHIISICAMPFSSYLATFILLFFPFIYHLHLSPTLVYLICAY